MRVGVYPVVDRSAGGTYQYSATVLHALDDLRDDLHPVIVHDHPRNLPATADATASWDVLPFGPPTLGLAARGALVRTVGEPMTMRIAAKARRSRHPIAQSPSETRAVLDLLPHPRRGSGAWLRRHGLDLMVYPAPTNFSFECEIPYVMAVHDLQHRIHPEFPEVSANGEWEAREYLFSNAIRMAQAILVDSEVGREDVLEHYGQLILPDRVRVLQFALPPYLVRPPAAKVAEALRARGLTDRYLLFPAQLWPHKNHHRVVEAVGALHRQGLNVTVVLTGSASGDIRSQVLAEILDLISAEGIAQLVRVLGYVDDATIACLYAGAAGVLLPTFFGPTNIPVIEAWAMGVPVLTSDIRGIREQCGDAALLVDPSSTEAIADGIRRLWSDEDLRGDLIAAGTTRVTGNDMASFTSGLASILRDVAERLPAGPGQGATS